MGTFWAICTLALAMLSALLADRIIRPRSLPLRVLVVLVLFVLFTLLSTHIVAVAEFAMVLRAVTLPAIAGVAALLFAMTAAFHVAVTRRDTGMKAPPGPARGQIAVFAPLRALPRYAAAIILICAATWTIFVINAVLSFSFGWDGLSYHLPLAVNWLQDGSLRIPVPARWQFSLPANGEIGMALFLAAGFERFVFAFNLLAFSIGSLAIFVLARNLSENPVAAILGVAVFAMLPIVQFQATTAYIDLFGSSFILAGVAIFSCRARSTDARPDTNWYAWSVVLTGLALGISIGSKHVYYAYGALCCAGALAIVLFERKRHNFRPLALPAILVLCVLVPSSFWLLRAALATGNPFYPIAVNIAGMSIFDGHTVKSIVRGATLDLQFVSSTFEWLFYPWTESKVRAPTYGTGSGVGAAWTTFVPLGLVLSTIFCVRNWRGERARLYIGLLVLLVAMVVLWWFGLRRLPRFGLVFVSLACVLTVPLFDYFIEQRLKALKIALFLSFATAAALSGFLPAHQLLGRIRANDWSRAAVFEMPGMLDELPDGAVVWNAGAPRTRVYETLNFALAGARLSNRVVSSRWRGLEAAQDFIRLNRVDYLVERAPFCCDEIERTGAKRVFEGQVGPTHKWRIWSISRPE